MAIILINNLINNNIEYKIHDGVHYLRTRVQR